MGVNDRAVKSLRKYPRLPSASFDHRPVSLSLLVAQISSTHRFIVALDHSWRSNRSSTGKSTIFLVDSVHLGQAGRRRRQQMDRLVVLSVDEIDLLVFFLDRRSCAADLRLDAAPFAPTFLGKQPVLWKALSVGSHGAEQMDAPLQQGANQVEGSAPVVRGHDESNVEKCG